MRLVLVGIPIALVALINVLVPPHMKPAARAPGEGVKQRTMKAAVYSEYGTAAQVLRVVSDRPVPEIAAHEVLIKVEAAALNPIDYKKMAGALFLLEAFTKDLDGGSVPGFDVAGRVVAVGRECGRLKVGDAVYAMAFAIQTGGVAEFVSVSERFVSLKPKSLSFAEAASIPLAGLTSLQALRNFGGLQKSEHVMILGGAGGTGTLAIQIAKALGAGRITTTASPAGRELVASLGADEVVDYRSEDWAEKAAGQKVGLVYDCVGGLEEWQRAQRLLPAAGGRYVTIAGDLQAAFTVPYLLARGLEIATRKVMALLGKGPSYDFVTTSTNHVELDTLSRLVAEGSLKPIVDKEFSLNDAVKAFTYLESGRAKGKVVITIGNEARRGDE